jgi:hypothetical protein
MNYINALKTLQTNNTHMADQSWGNKIFCECGTKYYTMNKKDKITCPTCNAEYIPEEINPKQTYSPVPKPELKEKKVDDLDNIDDVAGDGSEDDIISLDDQKEIEDSNEEFKTD